MSLPEIRIVSVPVDHEIPVFTPTKEDLESGLVNTIEERAREVLVAGRHRLLALKAPVPHHPTDDHTVYWVDRANGNPSHNVFKSKQHS